MVCYMQKIRSILIVIVAVVAFTNTAAQNNVADVVPTNDELRARVAEEQPKKTPDWFVEGRKREGELVAQYNRKIMERWIKKAPTSNLNATKQAIAKLIAYQKEIEAIRGDDPITEAYISAHTSCKSCIQAFFKAYYSVMALYVPLVRTPDTQEGKKLKLEETPWVLPHPYE